MVKLVTAEVPHTSRQVVNVLEELLERARNGEIVQLAAAFVTDDGCTSYGYACPKNVHMATMLGSIDLMHRSIAKHIEEHD